MVGASAGTEMETHISKDASLRGLILYICSRSSPTVLSGVDEGADAERPFALTVEGLHLHLKLGGRGDFGVFVDILLGLRIGHRHPHPLRVVMRLERDDVAKITAVVVLRLDRLQMKPHQNRFNRR